MARVAAARRAVLVAVCAVGARANVPVGAPVAEVRSWAHIAVLASREARKGEADDLNGVDVMVALASRQKSRNFSPGGNLTFRCSDDGGRGWIYGSTLPFLRGEQYNLAHVVVRCPYSGYGWPDRTNLTFRVERRPDRTPYDRRDDCVDLVVRVRPRPPRSRLTSCVEPLYGASAAALERFYRFYRHVGVARFVVFDGSGALRPVLEPLDDVDYHGWTFKDVLGDDHVTTAKGGPVGQHLATAYCAFVYENDAAMLLSVDLDEIATCGRAGHLGVAVRRAAKDAGTDNPCACLLRWLYDGPLRDGPLPTTVTARQVNRKCLVDPSALVDANFHRPKCRGHKGTFAVDPSVCWINHYRDAGAGKRPLDAFPLPDGPEERTDLAWAAPYLGGKATWGL